MAFEIERYDGRGCKLWAGLYLENWEAVSKTKTLLQLSNNVEFVVNVSVSAIEKGFSKRLMGASVQEAYPMLTAREREALKSGKTFAEQEEIFGREAKEIEEHFNTDWSPLMSDRFIKGVKQ